MTISIENKWRHGPTRFELPRFDGLVGNRDGFFPLPVVLDAEVGYEVILVIRDQTSFMAKLKQVKPFRLEVKSGCGRNEHGSLMFFLFFVENPSNKAEPFAAWDCYLNPLDEVQVSMWLALATQTHWHVFLVGAEGEQEEFFEFENNFGLNRVLGEAIEMCQRIPTVDFETAKETFMNEHSIEDLFRLE